MNEKVQELIENKQEIDSAFSEMMLKVGLLDQPALFKHDKAEGEEFLDIIIGEYKKVKCWGCCSQE
jgi:hypothetical protein